MIEVAFELTTGLFESVAPGAHFINERCFGEDFATWLANELTARALVASEAFQEDWGWAAIVTHEGSRFTLGVSIIDESFGRAPAEWRVSIAFEKPLNRISSWFRPAPRAALDRLATIIESALRANPGIEDLRRVES